MASQLQTIQVGGKGVDLSGRVQTSSTVIASPSANSETVVATTPAFDNDVAFMKGCLIIVELAYTIGTSGTACTVQIRQGTSTSGSSVYSTGAQTGGHSTAAQLVADSAGAFDTGPAAAQQYSVTLTVTGGAATSTVSKVNITAIAI